MRPSAPLALLFIGLIVFAGCGGDFAHPASGGDTDTTEPQGESATVELSQPRTIERDDVDAVDEKPSNSPILMTVDESAEAAFLTRLNQERVDEGLSPLEVFWDLEASAREHSETMATQNDLHHNPELAGVTDGQYWTTLGENVGRGGSVDSIHHAFMASDGHRANILGDYTHVGIGAVEEDSQIWVTVVFMKSAVSSLPAEPSSGSSTPTWFLNNTMYGGSADVDFKYANDDDIFITGDWNGDGRMTPGVVRGSTWHLTNSNTGGPADYSFHYGRDGDHPIVGDWNGDGRMTPGIIRGTTWHLTNSPSGGPSDYSFTYGREGDEPIVGDWNGDGRMTPGVIRGTVWHLTNSPSGGPADYSFHYGRDGDEPLVGDWNGDGRMTPGILRGNDWHLTNSPSGGPADYAFTYGRSDDLPIVGDWNGDGSMTSGVIRLN